MGTLIDPNTRFHFHCKGPYAGILDCTSRNEYGSIKFGGRSLKGIH